MSNGGPSVTLDACGCCALPGTTPVPYDNRPGLGFIRYRLGTRASFYERLLTRMAEADFQPLDQLSTRAPDDLSMALLDACATVCDVLAFYQEYVANEGFLRTATERRSILELARTVGYELAPGAAATTKLAFSVQDPPQQSAPPGTPGVFPTPTRAVIPVGTKVQSVPQKPGELPQTFETLDAIDARYEWTTMRPRATRRQVLTIVDGVLSAVCGADGTTSPVASLYFAGASTAINPNDLLVIVIDGSNVDPNDPFGSLVTGGVAVVAAAAVTADPVARITRVDLRGQTGAGTALPFTAPQPPYVPVGTIDPTPRPLDGAALASIYGAAFDEQTLATLIHIESWDESTLLAGLKQIAASAPPPAGAYVLRQRVGFFGHNAQPYSVVHPSTGATPIYMEAQALIVKGGFGGGIRHHFPSDSGDWDSGRSIWQDENGADYAADATTYVGMQVFLERTVPGVRPGGWVVFQQGSQLKPFQIAAVADTSLVEFGLTGKATGLALYEATTTSAPDPTASDNQFGFRTTTAYVQSDALTLAETPIDPVIHAGALSIMLDRVVLGIARGCYVALSGQGPATSGSGGDGNVRSEVLQVAGVIHTCGFTTITFTTALANSYALGTVTLNANVTTASHGETVPNEILGSGDGTQPNQSWKLSRKPVTYLASASAGTAVSTIGVTVNGVAWTEVPALYGQPSNARVFTSRTQDDGSTVIGFGDGDQGARLPTGTANVVGTYRVGLGSAGEVAAGSLAILQSRPLGVKGVTNPLAASGGQAPETIDDARAHAPMTTRTFDRVVSVDDYGDFAAAFPGIGKALATPVWSGRERVVHLTVGSATSGPVSSDVQQLLLSAILRHGDPTQPVQVDTYVPRSFRVTAGLVVDPAYDLDDTKANVAAALTSAFSFTTRRFGQTVTEAEVMATIQSVPGIVACTISTFVDPSVPITSLADVIAAHSARWDPSTGRIVPAELLLIDWLSLTLTAAHSS